MGFLKSCSYALSIKHKTCQREDELFSLLMIIIVSIRSSTTDDPRRCFLSPLSFPPQYSMRGTPHSTVHSPCILPYEENTSTTNHPHGHIHNFEYRKSRKREYSPGTISQTLQIICCSQIS